MFNSIRWKITALYLILILAALILFSFTLKGFLENYFINKFETNLIRETKLVRRLLEDEVFNDEKVEVIDRLAGEYSKDISARITIIKVNGRVLGDSAKDPMQMENHLQRPEVQEALKDGVGKSTRYSETLQIDMKYVALPITDRNKVVGIVRLALSLSQVQKVLSQILWKLIKSGLIAISISSLLVLILTKRISSPIEKITYVAGQMAQGFLDQRIRINSQDELGRLSQAFNNMADKLKNKINEISSEKNKIEAILSNMADGVIAVDQTGKIILFNPTAEKMFRVNEKDTLGKYTMEVTRNHRLDEVIMSSFNNEQEVLEEVETIYPNERIIRIHVTPIKSKENDKQGAVAVLRDVTELRKLEQMRTEFVGNVSHELRTPLTSIKGYVETLLDSDDYEPYILKRFLQIIKDEADRLEQLIVDLLDLSQIEAMSDGLDKGQINLNEVIEEVLTIMVPKAMDKDISLKVNVPEELSTITGNGSQVRQLYINLVDNAIKYTPDGGKVEIKVNEDEEEVWTEIIDTGMGIPKKDLERIFERFYRVDKARSRKMGGTGLGLSIVKHILEGHNGKIEVESEVEEGTKFIFSLPK